MFFCVVSISSSLSIYTKEYHLTNQSNSHTLKTQLLIDADTSSWTDTSNPRLQYLGQLVRFKHDHLKTHFQSKSSIQTWKMHHFFFGGETALSQLAFPYGLNNCKAVHNRIFCQVPTCRNLQHDSNYLQLLLRWVEWP